MKMRYLNYLNTFMALVMVCLQAGPALSMAVENGVVDAHHIESNAFPFGAVSAAALILLAVSIYVYRRKKISVKQADTGED